SVGYFCEDQPAIVTRAEADFCNTAKLFANFVAVLLRRRSDFVEIDALIKVRVVRREVTGYSVEPRAGPGIAGIKQAGAIGIPGGAASSSGKLHARNFIGQLLARISFVDVQRSLFTPVFRQRHCNDPSIM